MWKSSSRSLNTIDARDINRHCGFYVPDLTTLPPGVQPKFTEMNIYNNGNNTFTIHIGGDLNQLQAFLALLTCANFTGPRIENNQLTFTADARRIKQFVTLTGVHDNTMISTTNGLRDFSFIISIINGIDSGANMTTRAAPLTEPATPEQFRIVTHVPSKPGKRLQSQLDAIAVNDIIAPLFAQIQFTNNTAAIAIPTNSANAATQHNNTAAPGQGNNAAAPIQTSSITAGPPQIKRMRFNQNT